MQEISPISLNEEKNIENLCIITHTHIYKMNLLTEVMQHLLIIPSNITKSNISLTAVICLLPHSLLFSFQLSLFH